MDSCGASAEPWRWEWRWGEIQWHKNNQTYKQESPPPPAGKKKHVYEDTHPRTHIIATDQNRQDTTGGCLLEFLTFMSAR